jgi:hypothetical protein
MTRRPSRSAALPRYFGSVLPAACVLALVGCTSAGPPKPPPPAIQADARPVPPSDSTTDAGRLPVVPTGGATPLARAAALPPPTMPPSVTAAAAAAPAPLTEVDEDALPSARDLANGMIAALSRATTARLSAKLPNEHQTDVLYVAPDRAAVIELDVNGQEAARYVIIGDTGYSNQTAQNTGWRKMTNEGYRKQSQIFRPMQIALATGKPRALESGAEVERVEVDDKPALRAQFEYTSSEELQELGLMRSGANQLEIVVDPTTWLPIRTREVTQGSVTEVRFVGFDQPLTIDPPES